jgi:hypothetical protein
MNDYLLEQPETSDSIRPLPPGSNGRKPFRSIRKPLGLLFIITAVIGMIFSLVGLIEVWRYRPIATQAVTENLALFSKTLKTTQDGLLVIDQMVQNITIDVASLETTTQALALTIRDTTPMLDSLSSLTGKDLPAAITATQTSLASAQGSAQLIDNTLEVLTNIPFSPVKAYKPDVPLHTALSQVSTSLNTLPPSLTTIRASLATGKSNLGALETELNKISETTKGISTSLSSAQTVIGQYKEITAELETRVEVAQQAAPFWITAITWILSLVFGLLFISQLGLGIQGLEMLRDERPTWL